MNICFILHSKKTSTKKTLEWVVNCDQNKTCFVQSLGIALGHNSQALMSHHHVKAIISMNWVSGQRVKHLEVKKGLGQADVCHDISHENRAVQEITVLVTPCFIKWQTFCAFFVCLNKTFGFFETFDCLLFQLPSHLTCFWN